MANVARSAPAVCLALSAMLIALSPNAMAQPATQNAAAPAAQPVPAQTPAARIVTPPAAASPAATATATPVATPTPKPSATPKLSSMARDLIESCGLHFPGKIQGELRSACASVGVPVIASEKGLTQTRCRLNYGEEPRAVMACLIGVAVADDLTARKDDYKSKLQLCAEQYPQHTEIDAFLQESCLTGIHLPDLMTLNSQPYETCGQLSSERSFIGPCSVGLSLASELTSGLAKDGGKTVAPNQQNKICEQFFDHKRFHLTYRACLNARSIAVSGTPRVEDMISSCSNIVSDPGNDNERAACLIGSNIHRSLSKKEDVARRFNKCGENKVSYQDRDVLACLTAASLIDLVGKPGADSGCRSVFKDGKASSRNDCLRSISQTF